MPKIQRLLVVNRGEIAIRVCRAAEELGITTITLYAYEDRFALHRYKANESYQLGTRGQPLQAYLDIQAIIKLALSKQVDAVHPGYGFLSESQEFAQKCQAHGIIFIGPRPEVLRALGDKVNGRSTAEKVGVPTLQGVKLTSGALPESHSLEYPLMVKAAHGGGGRGMRVVHQHAELSQKVQEARQEALSAFGSDVLFLEAFLPNVRHVEVQILGDTHGNIVHLYERDCSLQRRHQKVIEYSPALRLDSQLRDAMCQDALKICREVAYTNAGTVEFLLDDDSGRHYFIEVNPRIQVEHTVTEVVTGLDIVKAQILVAEGHPLSHPMIGIKSQSSVQLRSCALQCRVTTENPALNFMPDYGRITHYRSTGGCGVRLDAGTAFSGASVSPFYDPLLVKVTCSGNTFEVAINRMERALSEFCIHGVQTNLTFLLRLLSHPSFREGLCCTRFIDQNEAMFHQPAPRYAGDALCEFLANLAVNGNPLIPPKFQVHRELPVIPDWPHSTNLPNLRATLRAQGPHQFCKDLLKSQSLWITDTTMRDAHQSLFATRMRTYDMLNIAEAYNQLPLFSMECWGGATFDVSMRFLKECPWERLRALRQKCPNMLLQMLLRGSNAVGYTNYPDNLVREFILRAYANGVDIFRVFDCLNWTENMKVAIQAILECQNAICEGAICYTGDILDPEKTKYDLAYYCRKARELEALGVHIICIKDMAGLLKPLAATRLIEALKEHVRLPLCIHTHDTSGGQMATLMAASQAGVQMVDAAFAPFSGLTSQPNLNTLVEMLRFGERESRLDYGQCSEIARYWETVRQFYSPFEPLLKTSTADVYKDEIPGGQYTNLVQQAHAMGLSSKWHQITQQYRRVNQLFGDLVKVTPSSKVVGDLALFLVTNKMDAYDILEAGSLSLPASVLSFLQGGLGQPEGGFPDYLLELLPSGIASLSERPSAGLAPIDFGAEKTKLTSILGQEPTPEDLISYLLYPQVYLEFFHHTQRFGYVSGAPTPIFWGGPRLNEEISIELQPGQQIVIVVLAIGSELRGQCLVHLELNGQPMEIIVPALGASGQGPPTKKKADFRNVKHVGASIPGHVAKVHVKPGMEVQKNDPLLVLEAMKMETTLYAEQSSKVAEVLVQEGDLVQAKDLLVIME